MNAKPAKRPPRLFARVAAILEEARAAVVRTVNTRMVVAYWLIGREIVQEEQGGKRRATYGDALLEELSRRLTERYGKGYSVSSLKDFRQFHLCFADRLPQIRHELRGELAANNSFRVAAFAADTYGKSHTPCGESRDGTDVAPARAEVRLAAIRQAAPDESSPSALTGFAPELSWSHYRLLKSRNKKGVMALAREGNQPRRPVDILKDPFVLEFLDLPDGHELVEGRMEQALVGHMRQFLLELGCGFAFVARQQRLTLDGDHFYVDLTFYHTRLKCYVLIDLKVGKLTQQDLGQMQLYVNYYDRERLTPGDNPTLGLSLCTDKNDAVVRYTLGEAQQKKIFASRYKLHLPSEAELKSELKRELRCLGWPRKKP